MPDRRARPARTATPSGPRLLRLRDLGITYVGMPPFERELAGGGMSGLVRPPRPRPADTVAGARGQS